MFLDAMNAPPSPPKPQTQAQQCSPPPILRHPPPLSPTRCSKTTPSSVEFLAFQNDILSTVSLLNFSKAAAETQREQARASAASASEARALNSALRSAAERISLEVEVAERGKTYHEEVVQTLQTSLTSARCSLEVYTAELKALEAENGNLKGEVLAQKKERELGRRRGEVKLQQELFLLKKTMK